MREENSNYEDFRKKRIVVLGKPELVELYRTKVRQMRQISAEAIPNYADRVLDTVTRAYPDAEETTRIELACSTFVDGLVDPETRRCIRLMKVGRALDWTETIELAQARNVSDAGDPHALHAVADARPGNFHSPRIAENRMGGGTPERANTGQISGIGGTIRPHSSSITSGAGAMEMRNKTQHKEEYICRWATGREGQAVTNRKTEVVGSRQSAGTTSTDRRPRGPGRKVEIGLWDGERKSLRGTGAYSNQTWPTHQWQIWRKWRA